MEARVRLNNSGMSLVEVMVANLILIVVFLALMETATLALRVSTENALQDMAADIAERELNDARNTQFSAIVSVAPKTVTQSYRNGTFDFTVTRTVSVVSTDYKQVTISVRWIWKKISHNHTVNTYVKNS